MKCYKIIPPAWEQRSENLWRAETVLGVYLITRHEGIADDKKRYRVQFPWPCRDNSRYCASVPDGQRIAEDHYRAAILPALEEVPEVNQRMLGALRLALEHVNPNIWIATSGDPLSERPLEIIIRNAIAEAERGRE